jgi:membrane protein insertase Oxa1/YidC/SpoIIIJ
MYDFLGSILYPVIFLIEKYFFLVNFFIANPLASIVVTSLSISIISLPILRIVKKFEGKKTIKAYTVEKKVRSLPSTLKGEMRFRAIERIYLENNFHPIQNIYKGTSFYIILPILISAYLFFLNNIDFFDINIFGLFNLSKPDKILFGFNLLPLLIFIINFLDFAYRNFGELSGQKTYLVISFVICLLIYNMPSSLTVYWLTSSIFSLLINTRILKNL